MTNVIMPVLGMSQDSGKLVSWLKKVGEWVEKGEPLMEVETDKATVEIESPASGVLQQLLAEEGEDVPVAQVIALIEEVKTTVLASPKARRLAAQLGLDLAQLQGRGPQGAVLASDVMAANAQALPAVSSVAPTPLQDALPKGSDIAPESGEMPSEMPIGTLWRQMIERLTASWPNTPHFYLMREVNATRLIAWRKMAMEQGSQSWKSASKITYTDLLVKLAALALRQHPQVNTLYQNGKILRCQEAAISLAIALEEGLVAPVIHRADTLSLSQIAEGAGWIDRRAQAGRLHLEDIQGSALTLSNLGMYKVDGFYAVVNPPQAATLAIGRIAERVIALNGQPAVQPMMLISVSFDHRLVDGARGALFLDTLGDLIENPPDFAVAAV